MDQRTKKQGNKGTLKCCETREVTYIYRYTSGLLISNFFMIIIDRISDWMSPPLFHNFLAVPLFPCFFVLWSLIEPTIPSLYLCIKQRASIHGITNMFYFSKEAHPILKS